MTGRSRTPSLFEEPERATAAPGEHLSEKRSAPRAPLAQRMRPRTLSEILGQESILGPGEPLHEALNGGGLFSMILWGPPGSGKTTLASAMQHHTDSHF